MTQPAPQEIRDIAAALVRIADENAAAHDPDDHVQFYARCIIHGAALNLLDAAGTDSGFRAGSAYIAGRAMHPDADHGTSMNMIPNVSDIGRTAFKGR